MLRFNSPYCYRDLRVPYMGMLDGTINEAHDDESGKRDSILLHMVKIQVNILLILYSIVILTIGVLLLV